MELSTTTVTVDDVRAVVVETLGLDDRAGELDAASPLLGAVPELDSLGVLELVAALEERFGAALEDDDVTAEAFATLGSLTALVGSRAG